MAQVETKNRATSSEEARREVLQRVEEEGVKFALQRSVRIIRD